MTKNRMLMLSFAAAGALLAAGAAEARVAWSIGFDAPGVSTVVSNRPVYRAAPIYVAPEVVYAPAPVYRSVPRYVAPPVVRYLPAPVVYGPPVYDRPAPVVVHPGYRADGGEHRHGGRWERDRWDGRR